MKTGVQEDADWLFEEIFKKIDEELKNGEPNNFINYFFGNYILCESENYKTNEIDIERFLIIP